MIPYNEPIIWEQAGELDVWGKASTITAHELYGNLRSEIKTVTNDRGDEQVSTFTILLRGVVGIKVEDKIQFVEPNGEVIRMNPISVKYMRDIDGKPKYTKVVL